MLGLLSVGLYYFSAMEIRLEICHFLGSLLSLLPCLHKHPATVLAEFRSCACIMMTSNCCFPLSSVVYFA